MQVENVLVHKRVLGATTRSFPRFSKVLREVFCLFKRFKRLRPTYSRCVNISVNVERAGDFVNFNWGIIMVSYVIFAL